MTLPVNVQLQVGNIFSSPSGSEVFASGGHYTASFPFPGITIDTNANSVLVFFVNLAGFNAAPVFSNILYGGVSGIAHWLENSGDTYTDRRGTLTVLCPVPAGTTFTNTNLTFDATHAISPFTFQQATGMVVQNVDQSRLPPTFKDNVTAVLVPWSLTLPSINALANEMIISYCLPSEADAVTPIIPTPAGTYADMTSVNITRFTVSVRQISANETDTIVWTRSGYAPARQTAWASSFSLPTLISPIPFGGSVYGKFAGVNSFAPVATANLGNAKPRIWQPYENLTVKVPIQ